ncbi:carcinoembryonic antigen-related cell adhesion molecule 1-like [Latimeria chalumnae]|uniref:carcinoembryonic antigen-related cell adhesion molecule 1-like n=1 Tax=Latimeria chalumnae TaxID=7897 RepID=UPI00313D6456
MKSTLDTNTIRSQLARGNATLSLRNVKTADSGVYICEVGDGIRTGRGSGTRVTVSSNNEASYNIRIFRGVLGGIIIVVVAVILLEHFSKIKCEGCSKGKETKEGNEYENTEQREAGIPV